VKNYAIILGAVALGGLLGYGLGRYRAELFQKRVTTFQNRGESLVSETIANNFGPPDYHLFNHLTLKLNEGTTQIDHVLVSRFGVFVIETKDYKGWIFANPEQAQWTQVLFNGKRRFQNPIVQNKLHVQAVSSLLDFLPTEAIHSVVVFAGEAEFKSDVPRGVFTLSEMINYLRGCQGEVMSINRMQFCVGRLEAERLAISGETDVAHVAHLKQRRRLRE